MVRKFFDFSNQVFSYINDLFNLALELFLHRKSNLLALDIGPSSIKAIELGMKHNQIYLVKFAVIPLPDGCVSGHTIENYSIITEKLQELVNTYGYNNRDAAIILSGPQVITQLLKVPNGLEAHQLATHVELEAEKWLPFNTEEIALDFGILQSDNQQDGITEVLLAATRKSYVDEYINVLKAANLNVRVMDVYSCVIGRLSTYSTSKQLGTDLAEKVIGMIDIGHDIISLSIFKNEKQLYIKEQNFGGRVLNDLIQQEHGVDFQYAEKLKVKHNDPAISKLIDTFISQLVNQVYHMLQHFYSSATSKRIDYIFIFGGSANLLNIDHEIEAKLDIPVKVLNIFCGINTDKYSNDQFLLDDALRLAPVCGLALRSYIA